MRYFDKHSLELIIILFISVFPHFFRLPYWIIIWCIGLWAYIAIGFKKNYTRPSKTICSLLALFGIISVLLAFGKTMSRDWSIALLAVMASMKLLEIQSFRDRIVTIFLNYFIIITTLFYNDSLAMTLYMFFSVLITTTCLIHINHPKGLFIQQFKLASTIIAQSIPLMIILFFLFPRLQGSLWGIKQTPLGITGFSEELYLGNIANLVRSDKLAFRVKFKGKQPSSNKLYWRGLVLWDFDNIKWTRGRKIPYKIQSFYGEQKIEYNITLEPHNHRWLFTLDLPFSITGKSKIFEDFTVRHRYKVNERMQYHSKSYLSYNTGDIGSWEQTALALPENGNEKARNLAKQWKDSSTSKQEIINKAFDYFKNNNFVYTLKFIPVGKNTIDAFLFKNKKGYCEHYAASFAFIMRAAGVPARIVVGYLGGELNPFGNYMAVKQSQAHAWNEIWLQDKGWIRIDPTAAVAPSRIEQGLEQALADEEIQRFSEKFGILTKSIKNIQFAIDAINNQWDQWIIGYNYFKQRDFFKTLGFDINSIFVSLKAFLLGFILSIIFLFSIALYFYTKKQKKQDIIQQTYNIFCMKLAKIGLPKMPSQGPLDFSNFVISVRKDLRTEIVIIRNLYIKLRYKDRIQNKALIKQFRLKVKQFNPSKASNH